MSLAARCIAPVALRVEGDLQVRVELLESVNASLRRTIDRLQGETRRRVSWPTTTP